MKLKTLFISTIFAAVAAGTASADSLLGTVGGTLSTGYDTDYYFRGANLGGNPVWTGLDLEIPLTDNGVALGLGAWYINPTDGFISQDELDLYASIAADLGAVSVGLSYTAYIYPNAGGDTNELGLTVGTSLGPVDVGIGYHYDLDLETNYIEASVGTSYELTDSLSVSLGATVGFLEEDYAHTTVVASLPIVISDNAVLEPYIAGVFTGDDVFESSDNEVFGGISLSVSF